MAKRRSLADSPSTIFNRLLAMLAPDEYRRLLPLLEPVPLKLKRILYKPGEVVDYVYFPGGGFASVVTVLANGGMVEVATIGNEGIVGLSAVAVGYREPTLTMVQMETDVCHRMPAAAFRRELDRHGALQEIVSRFSQALMGVIMQSTACNATHTIEQRLARWLLTAHDRVGRASFPLTQEFVAMMLGAARPTVSIVAGIQQRAGLISYRRGHITILNRKMLEAASCECYRVTVNLLSRVPGPASRRTRA